MALLEFTTLQDVEKQSVDRVLDLAASGRAGKGCLLYTSLLSPGKSAPLLQGRTSII